MNASLPPPGQPRTERAEAFQLSDGREVVVRPIAPADAAPIAASYHLLNEEEVRRRFLHLLTHPAEGSEFVVVAAEPLPPGDALVAAVARLARDDEDASRAEFGILVSHFVAGRGLGRLLMQRLIEWCRANGIRELWGDVLEDNAPMLELASHLGFRRETVPDSPGLVRVTLPLPNVRH